MLSMSKTKKSWNNDESMIRFWIIRKEKWKTYYGVYSRTILGSYDTRSAFKYRGFLFDVFGQVNSTKSVIQKSNQWIFVTYASFILRTLWKFGWNVFGSTQGIRKKALVSIQVANCQHCILFLFTWLDTGIHPFILHTVILEYFNIKE